MGLCTNRLYTHRRPPILAHVKLRSKQTRKRATCSRIRAHVTAIPVFLCATPILPSCCCTRLFMNTAFGLVLRVLHPTHNLRNRYRPNIVTEAGLSHSGKTDNNSELARVCARRRYRRFSGRAANGNVVSGGGGGLPLQCEPTLRGVSENENNLRLGEVKSIHDPPSR